MHTIFLVKCQEWTHTTNISLPPCFILVTTEKTNECALQDFPEWLVYAGILTHVIINEVHNYMTHENF